MDSLVIGIILKLVILTLDDTISFSYIQLQLYKITMNLEVDHFGSGQWFCRKRPKNGRFCSILGETASINHTISIRNN